MGFLLSFRYQRSGRRLLIVSLFALYICSLPIFASFLSASIQHYAALNDQDLIDSSAQAIVVLGGGIDYYAPEYDNSTNISLRTLGRVRYAARLARRTGLPVLVSGGTAYSDKKGGLSEGEIMHHLLRYEFAITNEIWLEKNSRTTRQNAFYSSQLLRAKNIDTVFIVTHAAHMARALTAFQRNDINSIPAPTLFFSETVAPSNLQSWLPSAAAIDAVRYVTHEWLGQLWYWWLDELT